jgi:4-hydroxybenzoate polyprenyltransferase
VAALTERLRQYGLLMRLDRPIGIYLLLWPTLWALWIASRGRPDPLILVVFVLGVTLMRSAGCVINDYADRDFDPYVSRTRGRPLASGSVQPGEAVGLFLALSALAFGLVLLTNPLTVLLSIVGGLLAASYPFTKRITHLPQVYLGVAFAWAVPMAFAAQTGAVPPVAWLLFLAPVFWATAYDTMYAMVDRDDDLKIGVKSTAVLFGHWDRIVIAGFQGAFFAVLLAVGIIIGFGALFYLGLMVAGGFALYQQYLIKDRDPARCFAAFRNNHWLGAAVFVGIWLDFWLG